LILRVRGIDLVDGTPIIDIKPYLPYADAKPDASGGYAEVAPGNNLQVRFSTQACEQLLVFSNEYPELKNFIVAVLQQDPRPAQHTRQGSGREFGMFLYDLNIRWKVTADCCDVLQIERAENGKQGQVNSE
jgi:hypothetical protein